MVETIETIIVGGGQAGLATSYFLTQVGREHLIEAARRFYVEVLGLEVERYHPTFVQFDHFAIASDESLSGTREPEVYWLVDDAEAAYKELSQKGEVSVPLRQMPFGKVFAIKDPNGRPRFLLEFARQRPSEPVK